MARTEAPPGTAPGGGSNSAELDRLSNLAVPPTHGKPTTADLRAVIARALVFAAACGALSGGVAAWLAFRGWLR